MSARTYSSINPATEEVVANFPELTDQEVENKLCRSIEQFHIWKRLPLSERIALIRELAKQVRSRVPELAALITEEMGKPIQQAVAEVEKCADLCDYYSQKAPEFLALEEVSGTQANKSYIRFDPIGGVLAVMPWNFPFWQVFRFAVPTLLAGNVGVLKHASNVFGCSNAIEAIFHQAGFPVGAMTSLTIGQEKVGSVIAHKAIHAVTLTGSESAGRKVASQAGDHLKKTVLELGGSDPFIVLPDADLETVVPKAIQARLQNNGQSCIAAKRFLIHDDIYDRFAEMMTAEMANIKMGDPMDSTHQLGPMARDDLRQELHEQVTRTVQAGGLVSTGGKIPHQKGWYYPATVLTNVIPGMAVFDEETFGPVAALTRFRHVEQAVELANRSRYGLGASVWTQDLPLAEQLAAGIDSGNVFLNEVVKSDPGLPFGGVKDSGYGRELGVFGIREFVNIKTVCIGRHR